MKAGYLFLCGSKTQDECFRRQLLGNVERHWGAVQEIKAGDILFLYNTKSRSLMGPFTAASEGGWEIDPEAWAYMKPLRFPAQVRVKWQKLHILKNASNEFTFLVDREVCRLTPKQTSDLLAALEQAPIFVPSIVPGIPPEIESDAERKFAKFLDYHQVCYIRFSQTPADFSKVLKEMKAKRPDFLVFSEQPLFVEVKPNPIRYKSPELILDLEEVEKLKQLELSTGLMVLIAFPIDLHGFEWRSFKPAWIWAEGKRKEIDGRHVLVVSIQELEKHRLPFI
jgi:hypothetical protein